MGKAITGIVGFVLVVVGTAFPQFGYLVPYGYSLMASNVLAVVAQALVGKPRARRLGQSVEYFGTVEPRRIIYGTMRVSGMNAIGAFTSGENNTFLHQVLVLAGHEVNDIGDTYFGEQIIEDADIGAFTSPASVQDGLVGGSGGYAGIANIRRYLGTATQPADFILQDVLFTSADTGHGIAYAAIRYEFDDKYSQGKPDPVTFVVEGKKVYDPRLDSSPGANPTNASYIAFSSNPALCAADYFTDTVVGLSVDPSKINWDTVVVAADICDETVSIPGPSTQSRYTCNVVLYAALNDSDRRNNLETLASAMLGHVVYRSGKYEIHAGAASNTSPFSTSFAITEDDLVGRISLRTEMPSSEKYNFVRGQFVDPERSWELAEFPPRANAAYEATDGERKTREAIFQATTNSYEAQRKAMVVLKRSRLKRQATLELGMSAFKIKPWDVGTVTLSALGWDTQLVRCMSWNLRDDGMISATFLEEDSTVWDDPEIADYSVPGWSTPAAGSGYVPFPPTNFTAQPVVDGILFSWTPAENSPPRTMFNIYEYTAATPFASATKIVSGLLGTSRTVIKSDTTTRYYWITAEYYGNEGPNEPAVNGIAGAALSISTEFRANGTTSSLSKAGTTSGLTSGNVTVSPVNGTASFTYAWTQISGSTSPTTITAAYPTSATTSFDCTGLDVDEVNSAIFRCTVTDSSSPQQTATWDVSVTFRRYDPL